MNAVIQVSGNIQRKVEFVKQTVMESGWSLVFRKSDDLPNGIEIAMHWQDKATPTHWIAVTKEEWTQVGRELLGSTFTG